MFRPSVMTETGNIVVGQNDKYTKISKKRILKGFDNQHDNRKSIKIDNKRFDNKVISNGSPIYESKMVQCDLPYANNPWKSSTVTNMDHSYSSNSQNPSSNTLSMSPGSIMITEVTHKEKTFMIIESLNAMSLDNDTR